MESKNTSSMYEVLNPWAEADPVPLKGISSRVKDLTGKKIGLWRNSKRAAPLVLEIVEKKLKQLFPAIEFSTFAFMPNCGVLETEEKDKFEDWVKGVDAVVFAYGD
jgi:hypothetical protein